MVSYAQAMRELDITTEEAGAGVAVVALAGEIDLYTCPEFKQELLRVIADGASLVVVDLTGTTFIDSTALGVLVQAVQRLRETDGGRFGLVVTDENIRRIFEMTGLERVFPIYGSRDEALSDQT